MLKEIKKEYESGKCTKIVVQRKGGLFASGKTYEVKLFVTKPRTKLPFNGEYEKVGKEIIQAYFDDQWMQLDKKRYSLKLDKYPDVNIEIKEVENE